MSWYKERLLKLLHGPSHTNPNWPLFSASLSELRQPLRQLLPDNPGQKWVFDAIRELLATENSTPSKPQYGTLPYRGTINDFPAYSALAAQPESMEIEPAYRRFQALFLLGLAKQESYISGEKVRSSMRSAGLACRAMSRLNESDVLWHIVRKVYTPEQMCDACEQLAGADSSRGRDTTYILQRILPFLRDVRDQRNPHKRRVKRETGGSRTYRGRLENEMPEASQRMLSVALIEPQSTEREKRQLKKEGLVDKELTRSALILSHSKVSSKSFVGDARGMTAAQAGSRLRIRARSYKASRQMSLGRPEYLNEVAAQIISALDLDCMQAAAGKHGERNRECERPLGMMFLLGCQIQDLHKIHVWARLADVPKAPRRAGIVLQTKEFVLPAAILPGGWRPTRNLKEKHRQVEKAIYLDVPTNLEIGQSLLSWAERRAGKKLYNEKSLKEWQRLAEVAIKKINDDYNTTLTVNRVTNYLQQAMYHQNGDTAESLMVSYAHLTAGDARLYYYAPELDELGLHYTRVWEKLDDGSDDSNKKIRSWPWEGRGQACVGSRAVAKVGEAQEMVDDFKWALRRLLKKRGRRSVEQWCEIHNQLTLYTIMQVQWTTGIRAVRDPIELDNYDELTGYLQITDKDSHDLYGARIVKLQKYVFYQMQEYLKYVDKTSRAIFGRPTRTAAFKLIDPDRRSNIQIGKKTISKHIRYYPFAPNGHRHYVRTRMREFGVDAVFVDALLGHGGIGREPYARHSAITPETMAKEIEDAQEKIWLEMGWEIIPATRDYGTINSTEPEEEVETGLYEDNWWLHT